MSTRSLKPAALAIITCLLLVGCIPVKNVEKAWQDADADKALAGLWVERGGGDGKVGFTQTDQNFLVTAGTDGLEGGCRSFTTNGHKYLIVANFRAAILGFDQVDEDTKDGTLLRYEVDGDQLTLYTYDQEKIDAAVKAGEVAGEFDEDSESADLTELDAATIEWLGKLGDQPGGWDAKRYQRK